MTNIKKIAIITLTLAFASSAMAATGTTTNTGTTTTNASLEVKSAPRLVVKTANSVTLEWDKVDAATSYIVKYSTKSVATSTEANPQYDNETDPVTTTGTVVSTLKPATDYFFSIVAVDKDNNESDTYSDELKVQTEAGAAVAPTAEMPAATGSAPTAGPDVTTVAPTTAPAATSFAIKNVTAIDNKTLDLEFSAPLGTAPVSIKVTKTSDSMDIPVASVTADPSNNTKAIAKILTFLDPSSTYTVTILSANDAAGNNIKQGIDGIKEFPTAATLAISPDANGLNAGGAMAASGTTMSGATTPNLEVAKAGPRENLIVILALILSLGMVVGYRKKFAK